MRSNKKKATQHISLFFVILVCALLCCACTYTRSPEQNARNIDFSSLEMSELEAYIEIGDYKGLTLTLGDKSKGEAVWDAVLENSHINDYPMQHFYYYIVQIKGQYEYYAESAGMSYDELIKELGVTDGMIHEEARDLTKKDILCAIIQKKEGILLTEEEKQTHLDRYVEKYVSEYGYSEDYVRTNMTEEIYGSMLYDKTTEFLILNNSFN